MTPLYQFAETASFPVITVVAVTSALALLATVAMLRKAAEVQIRFFWFHVHFTTSLPSEPTPPQVASRQEACRQTQPASDVVTSPGETGGGKEANSAT